jgi:hypothetical protein
MGERYRLRGSLFGRAGAGADDDADDNDDGGGGGGGGCAEVDKSARADVDVDVVDRCTCTCINAALHVRTRVETNRDSIIATNLLATQRHAM